MSTHTKWAKTGLIIGGFLMACGLTLKPYDSANILIILIGTLNAIAGWNNR